MNIAILSHQQGKDGHLLILTAKKDNTEFHIIKVYAPNKEDPDSSITLNKTIANIPKNVAIFVGGDFNLPMNGNLDRISKVKYRSNKYRTEIINLCKSRNLING